MLLELVDGDGDGRIDVDEEIRWTGALMRMSEAEARLDEDPTVPGAGYSAI